MRLGISLEKQVVVHHGWRPLGLIGVEPPALPLVLDDNLPYPVMVTHLHARPFLQTALTSLKLLDPPLVAELDGLNDIRPCELVHSGASSGWSEKKAPQDLCCDRRIGLAMRVSFFYHNVKKMNPCMYRFISASHAVIADSISSVLGSAVNLSETSPALKTRTVGIESTS